MPKTRECYERHKGACYCPETKSEAVKYGQLAQVAIAFYIQTGNPAELLAVYWYARYAFRAARQWPPHEECAFREVEAEQLGKAVR